MEWTPRGMLEGGQHVLKNKEESLMRYRALGRTGIQVGEIGVGCEGFLGKTPEQIKEWLDVMEAEIGRAHV